MINSGMNVHTIAHFKFREDKLEEVITELRRLMEVTPKEQGCLQYYYVQNLEDPTRITSCEVWETMEDLERHVAVIEKSKNAIFFEYIIEEPVITNFSKI